jgi:hypothetical protein
VLAHEESVMLAHLGHKQQEPLASETLQDPMTSPAAEQPASAAGWWNRASVPAVCVCSREAGSGSLPAKREDGKGQVSQARVTTGTCSPLTGAAGVTWGSSVSPVARQDSPDLLDCLPQRDVTKADNSVPVCHNPAGALYAGWEAEGISPRDT